MENKSRISADKVKNSNLYTGDTYNFNHSNMTLNKSKLYEFCKHFAELDNIKESEYNIELPTDISEKIELNQLVAYKEIFEEVSHTLEDTAKVLESIPKRSSITKKVKTIYLHKYIDHSNESKDKICKLVFGDLLEIAQSSFYDTKLYLEDITFAIHALMYYAFTKCQILDRVVSKS